MLNEIFYGFIQALTEFLPVSSSGHLAFFSNLISSPNLFFFTVLHLASLIAVLIFTRKEIIFLLKFSKESRKLWLYLIIATIPAGLIGVLFNNYIEAAFSSFLFLAIAFAFTGLILFSTRKSKGKEQLTFRSSLRIGFMQVLALFPGVSRSGMTISAALLQGIDRERAAKFSFLLFIPLSLGAFVLELKGFYFDYSLLLGFIVCTLFSILFLYLLTKIIVKGKFWYFSFYCWLISIVSFIIWLIY